MNKKKKKPRVGEAKVMKCKITGKKVKMEYIGCSDSDNGHPGWLCLHK